MEAILLKKYRRTAIVTIYAVILLIFVGGVVRGTGSGMGCPDWPKCFGRFVPPTDVSQLPANYQQLYVQQRMEKNERVAARLEKMGFKSLSNKMRHDPSIRNEQPFNAQKTWIEYINRLVGVAIGICIFLTLLRSLPFRTERPVIFGLSLLSFILVGLEGWLGSIVVSTNLMPGMITLHMALAILILIMLVTAVLMAEEELTLHISLRPMGLIRMGVGVTLLIFGQMLLGTQVREKVDWVAEQSGTTDRRVWLEHLGMEYDGHRALYYVLTVGVLYWVWQLRKAGFLLNPTLRKVCWVLLISLFLEILCGIGMARWGIPAPLQPLHLLFATSLLTSAYFTTGWLFWRNGTVPSK